MIGKLLKLFLPIKLTVSLSLSLFAIDGWARVTMAKIGILFSVIASGNEIFDPLVTVGNVPADCYYGNSEYDDVVYETILGSFVFSFVFILFYCFVCRYS